MTRERFSSIAELDPVDAQLGLLREQLRLYAYPGYPMQADRLVADPATLPTDAQGRLVLEAGPWNVDAHPDQPVREVAPSLAEQRQLSERNVLDASGRPLHPWFFKMIADPAIGVVLGKGMYWEWGDKNPTADSFIKVCVGGLRHWLLVRRQDTGAWAAPAGFVNSGELPAQAAIRESMEETGLIIPEGTPMQQIYEGPVADIRMASGWPTTTAYLISLSDRGVLPEVKGGDDAVEARWFTERELQDPSLRFFGSCAYMLALAMEAADKEPHRQ